MAFRTLTALEICAGAGGQSLGLERAGFAHAAVVEIDTDACDTLRANRPAWPVIADDVRAISGRDFKGIDLVAGGVPCPPFSIAGKQLGEDDERDLFPEALRLVEESRPAAVMLENVKGLASSRFAVYRRGLLSKFEQLGYEPQWRLLNASDYGVPQLRPRFLVVAIRHRFAHHFVWPEERIKPPTVGEALYDLMGSRSWAGAPAWAAKANRTAPTIVGGSKKHGGPDLGPSRARAEWLRLGVDGRGLADHPPGSNADADTTPRLTLRMVARLQGFPDDWLFAGRKTAAYRQVGNAFPPPVAAAVGSAIRGALLGEDSRAESSARQLVLPAVAGR